MTFAWQETCAALHCVFDMGSGRQREGNVWGTAVKTPTVKT